MKICKRLLLLFCVLAILLSSLSSCTGIVLLSSLLLRQQEPEITNLPASEKYAYTLTETDRQTFLEALDAVETLILVNSSANETEINAACETMENAYYHIATQAELAYIYHCLNMADAQKSEAYLYASAMRSDLYTAYEATCKRIDASDAPGRAIFFADWSQADLEWMRGYSEEHTAIKQQNDRLLVSYRSLSDSERYDRAPEFYLQLIANNNAIAALYGYENYLEYAYDKVYERDYTPLDAQIIHQSVKSILAPLCQTTLARFQEGYAALGSEGRGIVRALLEGEYSRAWELLDAYISSFPAETEEDMRSLFQTDNHFLTSAQNADPGAFTTYLDEYEQPVCYFGPGYHDGFTVIHEMGHYLSAFYTAGDLPMDIAETQSQANEWLFTAFLDQTLQDRALAQTIFYYQLHSALQSIVLASLVDEFEQSVYQNVPASETEFDARMEEICQGYGGVQTVKTLFADPLRYWRLVTLENPGYYISYAFSMLAAINFYQLAGGGYSTAQSVYLDLVALDLEEGEPYCLWLEEQHLNTPFEENYYQEIAGFATAK